MTADELIRDRSAAWCVGLPALLFVAVIAHHPVLGVARNASVDELVAGVSRIAPANAAFHAVVLLMLSAQAIGLWSFADRLGLDRIVVRSGVFFYGVSTLLLFIAGTVDGFATPMLGHGCQVDATRCAGALAAALSTEFAWIQAFTTVALGMQAIGLACWSAALALGWQGRTRLAGLSAIPVALVPLALLVSTDAVIGPGRLVVLVSSGCVCTFGAAVLLWTGALTAPRRFAQIREGTKPPDVMG
jgi:hypothetical protein